MIEVWRAIPGYPGYEASSLGRVRSIDRVRLVEYKDGRITPMLLRGQLLAQTPTTDGYLSVKIGIKGTNRATVRTHILIAATFLGPCPDGQEVRHDDNDRQNNREANLLYGTRTENSMDKLRHGTQPTGEACYQTKLTAQQVRWIRANKGVISQRSMAATLGVCQQGVCNAQRGKSWSHLK